MQEIEATKLKQLNHKPLISEYTDSVEFLNDQLKYLKLISPHFSIAQSCKKLRKVSPTLISLILKKKRRITFDRCEELSDLLKLSNQEKQFFKMLVSNEDPKHSKIGDRKSASEPSIKRNRKNLAESILNQPINVYVKDAFQIAKIQNNPDLIYQLLSFAGDPYKINKSIKFLLQEGYLKKTIDGKMVIDTPLEVAEPTGANKKIKNIHKKSLKITEKSLDLIDVNHRLANMMILPLNSNNYSRLLDLIHNFFNQIKDFTEDENQNGENLYQLTLHLCPTGGIKNEKV